jgi:spore coat protein U-like protein
LALIASVVIIAAAISAPSQAADTATATASAKVITPIAITNATNLSFGKFVATAAGNITVTTNGTRSADNVGILLSGGATGTAASFNITGEADATFTIDTTASSTTVTSGSDTMGLTLISKLAANTDTSGETTAGTLTLGAQTLYVGGVLAVSATQAVGDYSGTVSAKVAYN